MIIVVIMINHIQLLQLHKNGISYTTVHLKNRHVSYSFNNFEKNAPLLLHDGCSYIINFDEPTRRYYGNQTLDT